MRSPEPTFYDKPIRGEIVGKYLCLQPSASGREWVIKCQRMIFRDMWPAMLGVDLSAKTVIVEVSNDGRIFLVRSWH